jgi:hypothetical protein
MGWIARLLVGRREIVLTPELETRLKHARADADEITEILRIKRNERGHGLLNEILSGGGGSR